MTSTETFAESPFKPLHAILLRQFMPMGSVLLLPIYIPKGLDLNSFVMDATTTFGPENVYSVSFKNNHYLAQHKFILGPVPELELTFFVKGKRSPVNCEPTFKTTWNFRNPHMGRSTMCTEKLLRGFLSANNIRQTLNVTKITVISERMNIQVISTLVSQEELIKVLDSIQVIPKDMKKSISEPY